MGNKKNTGIILKPIDYWEQKLDINFETEFLRYKKLCTKLSKKEEQKLNGAYYITYSDWEQRMLNVLSSLDSFELYEYIHFLNRLSNNRNIAVNLTSVYIYPLVMAFVCPYLIMLLEESMAMKSGIAYIITSAIFFFCVYKVIKELNELKNDSFCCSFYADIKHIADNYYNDTKKNI